MFIFLTSIFTKIVIGSHNFEKGIANTKTKIITEKAINFSLWIILKDSCLDYAKHLTVRVTFAEQLGPIPFEIPRFQVEDRIATFCTSFRLAVIQSFEYNTVYKKVCRKQNSV